MTGALRESQRCCILRKTSGFRMFGAMRERLWWGAARSLFIHVCEYSPMAAGINQKKEAIR